MVSELEQVVRSEVLIPFFALRSLCLFLFNDSLSIEAREKLDMCRTEKCCFLSDSLIMLLNLFRNLFHLILFIHFLTNSKFSEILFGGKMINRF